MTNQTHTPQETADLILSNDEWTNMKQDICDMAQSHNELLEALKDLCSPEPQPEDYARAHIVFAKASGDAA